MVWALRWALWGFGGMEREWEQGLFGDHETGMSDEVCVRVKAVEYHQGWRGLLMEAAVAKRLSSTPNLPALSLACRVSYSTFQPPTPRSILTLFKHHCVAERLVRAIIASSSFCLRDVRSSVCCCCCA